MEQDIAILIADLSGYTALTEIHGSSSAADLIEKYIEIVERSLVADCEFHECVGDQVIVVSSSADQLISTASMLIQHTSNTDNFLLVHGGLHYGKILKRNNNLFGTAINLASRIAANANPGTFWCSSEYLNALTNRSSFYFESKGKHGFKNISEDKEVFELVNDNKKSFHIDPVCRMLINEEEKATKHPHIENIFFCSPGCLDIYVNKA